MAPVTANLGLVLPNDIAAIAAYVASRMGQPTPDRQQRAAAALKQAAEHAMRQSPADRPAQPGSAAAGAAIFDSASAVCHESGRALPFGGLRLALSTAVHACRRRTKGAGL
jgi:mono/diheme cytochrome c family protein